jgi:catechol 2,3-dioxygenase-like lactoylglutathione lyase family enzyme
MRYDPAVDVPGRSVPSVASAVHHVGMSVADLDAALDFWQRFLGLEPRWRTVLDRPYLGRHLGYPGVQIDAALLDLPGGAVLELLAYRLSGSASNPEATANPGNVHLCLSVSDARAAWIRAVAAGARPVVPDGPVEVDAGPNQGARAAYLRIHDGISLELFQPPPS